MTLRSVETPVLRPGGLGLTERALAACHWPAGARVLDVGCGVGTSVAYLREQFGLRAFGLDLAPAAHTGLPRSSPRWIVQADAQHLPLAAAVLDGLLCECTLSLLPEPAQALRGFGRVLRPGGCLVLSDVYARAPRAATRGALNTPQLDQLLRQAGFTTLVWEDHTPALKAFLGRLIFEHNDLPAAWRGIGAPAGPTAPRLGYFLLVARRS